MNSAAQARQKTVPKKKKIVKHVIVVTVAFAVVDVVTGCVARDQSEGGSVWCSGVTMSGLWLGHGHCLFTRLPRLVVGSVGCGRGSGECGSVRVV